MRQTIATVTILGSLATACSGDYVVSWSDRIARYNDSGQRQIGGFYAFEETIEAIAPNRYGAFYALANSLGVYPLFAFDPMTGLPTTGPPHFEPSWVVDPWDVDLPLPRPLLVSSVVDRDYIDSFRVTEPGCDPISSTVCIRGLSHVGRLTRSIESDGAEAIWGFGEIDAWRLTIDEPTVPVDLNIGVGLHRFRPGLDPHPIPVWRAPQRLIGSRYESAWLLFQSPDRVLVATEYGVLDFDPDRYPFALSESSFLDLERQGIDPYDISEPRSPLHEMQLWRHVELDGMLDRQHSAFDSDGLLRTFVDGEQPKLVTYDLDSRTVLSMVPIAGLEPGGGLLSELEVVVETALDDQDRLLVLTQRPCVGDCNGFDQVDSVVRRLLTYDSESGELLRVGAESLTSDYGTSPIIMHYLRPLPEPSATMLALIAVTPRWLSRRANLAVR